MVKDIKDISVIQKMKQCIKCNNIFPATEEYFCKRKDSKDGLRGNCIECVHKFRVKYYQDNREKAITYSAEWAKNNPEKSKKAKQKYCEFNKESIAEKNAQWWKKNKDKAAGYSRKQFDNNPERVRDRSRRYFKNNKEKVNARCRRWYEEHKKERAEYGKIYRMENKELVAKRYRNWYNANLDKVKLNSDRCRARKYGAYGDHTSEELKQLKENNKNCYWCGIYVGDKYHVDHVIPLSRGGTNYISNLVISCPKCNLSKYNKLPSENGYPAGWKDLGIYP